MKKKIAIAILATLLASSPALASGGRPHKPNGNWHILGSDDHQKKHNDPSNPVSVPEPATLLLVGLGIAGLAAFNHFKK
jgi:hypothetical protein